MIAARSSAAEVRNPVLGLPAAARLAELSPEAREALRAVLLDIRVEANDKAEAAWRKRKGPMAAYWRAVSTYALHIARALRPADRRPGWQGRALLERAAVIARSVADEWPEPLSDDQRAIRLGFAMPGSLEDDIAALPASQAFDEPAGAGYSVEAGRG